MWYRRGVHGQTLVVRGLKQCLRVKAAAAYKCVGLRVNVPGRRYYSRAPRAKEKPPRPGHVAEERDPRERDVEYGALRALHARRLITLCSTEHAARCAQMTPRNARGVVVRSGVKW